MTILLDVRQIETCYGYPISYPCINSTEVVYSPDGSASIMETFQKCIERIGGDAVFFPGFDTGKKLSVDMAVSLNNLVDINEVTNTISLDFFLTMGWFDPRIYMPGLFEELPTTYLDLTPAIGESNVYGAQTGIWLPDIVFPGEFVIVIVIVD